ncbi:MAG: extracellular solute-binding protein, partial [Clostridia bacterium]|nr:extracellular solute-binding protein [Clostridia bacterium]
MKPKKIKGLISAVIAGIILITSTSSLISFADNNISDELYSSADILQSNLPSYKNYIENNVGSKVSDEKITLTADALKTIDASIYENFEEQSGKSVYIKEGSTAEWEFTVKKAGFYNLGVNYYPVKSYGSPILADILLDGELPFKESSNVTFSRIWNDYKQEMSYDIEGNEILPEQAEFPRWINTCVEDSSGYVQGALLFYLSKGKHTLAVKCKRDDIVIGNLELFCSKEIPSYKELLAEYEQKGYKSVSEASAFVIQAEKASAKSDQMLYPQTDRSSPSVYPYSAARLRYNTIGGSQWKTVGQWIEWTVDIKESGLYSVATHFKQALKSNGFSVRELYIDGSLPFKEAADLSFSYKGSWQISALSDKQGNPYKIYFEKGKHTIRFKVGLGSYAEVLHSSNEYLNELNRIYREIVVVTGVSPDLYRNYNLDKVIPDTIVSMSRISQKLKKLEKQAGQLGQTKNKNLADIKRIYVQLDQMVEDSDTIPNRLSNFKDNISSFGTWINSTAEQPLEIDYISFNPINAKLGQGDAGFFSMLKHYFLQFVWSFATDYASVGQTTSDITRKITVWQTSGRDQAQILKSMINSTFTPQKSIAVDLQLVSLNSLTSAILAGVGPDVSLGVAQETPMNLALRNAVTDLTQFSDVQSVLDRFSPEFYKPFRFGTGIYALPETVNYPMLFYRKDIISELGIKVQDLETWETILQNVLPTLKKSSLSFGIVPSLNNYMMFLYQRGGELYIENGTKSGLATAEAINAMKEYSMLYTQYGLELAFDFANRFRSGELPIAVTEFTAYNQLTVFAPEIKGVWGMLPVPGFKTDDGINHSCVATLSGDIIISASKDKEASWEFLKWWLSAETQSAYGKNIESIVGSAARYNSANKEAFSTVQWDSDVKRNLMYQLELARPIKEVPGGYITTRLYDFAFRDIVYNGDDVRQTLTDTVLDINIELKNKRDEYK